MANSACENFNGSYCDFTEQLSTIEPSSGDSTLTSSSVFPSPESSSPAAGFTSDEGEMTEDEVLQQINEETRSEEAAAVCNIDGEDNLIPAEPPGCCSSDLQESYDKLCDLMSREKLTLNEVIQGNKAFRNPSYYETMIKKFDLLEYGTNYLSSPVDPQKFSQLMFYDELAAAQDAAMSQIPAQSKKAGCSSRKKKAGSSGRR